MQSRSFSLLASVSLIALSTLTGCSSMPGWMSGDATTGKPTTSMEALLNKSYKEAIERAEKAYDDGKKDDAVGLYMKAADYVPQEVYPLLQMSDILWEMHNTPEVISVLEHARVVSPDNVDVLRNLGRAYVASGSLKKAQDTYMAALAIAPAHIRVLNGLGLAYDLDGKHDVAQKHYRAGLELEPTDTDLQNNLAFSLISSGQFDEAAKILEPLVSSSAATARQRQNLALAYGMLGREDDVARVASADLSPAEIKRNLIVYAHLRSENEHGKILNNFGKPTFKNGSLSNKPSKPLPKHVGDDLKTEAKAPDKVDAPKVDAPKVEAPVVLTDIKSADEQPVDLKDDSAAKDKGIKLEDAKKAEPVKATDGEQPLASASVTAPTAMAPIISGPTAVGERKAKGEKAVAGIDNGTQLLTAKVDDVVKAPAKSSKKADDSVKAPAPVKAEAMINKTSEAGSSEPAKTDAPVGKKPVAKLVDEKVVDVPRVAPVEAKAAAEKAKKEAKKAAADKKATAPLTAPATDKHVLPTPSVASAPQKVEVKAAAETVTEKPVETTLATASAEPVTSVIPAETVKLPTPQPEAKQQEQKQADTKPATAPALGTGKVFLGTFASESEARVAWIRVWSAHSAALGTMVASIEPKDGQQSLYAVGAASKDEALKICAQLKDAGVECAAH